MKKLLMAAAILLTATQTLAHRGSCDEYRVIRHRDGTVVRSCASYRYHRHHHDSYGDGFVDAISTMSYSVSTTSDILDGDEKMDAVRNEADQNITNFYLGEGIFLSQDLEEVVQDFNTENKELSDEELVEILKQISERK